MVANVAEAVWLPLVEQAQQMDPDPALAGLDDQQLEARVRDVAAQVAALTCQWLEYVAELVVRGVWGEQGARTPGQWLSWAVGVAPATAREQVRVGLALRRLPQVRERFAAGTLSYSKVRAITRVATPACQDMVLHLADSAPAAELERIIAGSRRQLRREQANGADAGEPEVRSWWRIGHDDGTVEFRLRLPAEDAEALEQRLDRLVEVADRTGRQPELPDAPVDQQGADAESEQGAVAAAVDVPVAVRRAAAVCDALATAVAAGPADRSGADRHQVVIHARLEDLAAASAETGTTDAAAASAETAPRRRRRARPVVVTGRRRTMTLPASVWARLTCDVDLQLAGTNGEGHPADIGRRSRDVPADLRRAVLLRDRGCRFPGCGRVHHLHAHHVIHWTDGGPTDLDNLLTLCAFHHRFVHSRHWHLEPVDAAAGHYRFLPPSGTATDPAGGLPGVSAETAVGLLEDPWPQALQPPWWEGDPWDLSETIDITARLVLDPATDVTQHHPHPAMAA